MKDIVDLLKTENVETEGPSGCSTIARWLLKNLGPMKVIEIGGSYGAQLGMYAPFASMTVCIDTMYDWVPDVPERDGFDRSRIDQKKLESWNKHADACGTDVRLVINSSYMAHNDPENEKLFSETQVLIIDGNHHGAEVVKDYTNYRKFMTNDHYVIWDDVNIDDVNGAATSAKNMLESEGYAVHERDFKNARLFFVSCPLGDNGSIPVS
jgi:cephalosporin hydroxylase